MPSGLNSGPSACQTSAPSGESGTEDRLYFLLPLIGKYHPDSNVVSPQQVNTGRYGRKGHTRLGWGKDSGLGHSRIEKHLANRKLYKSTRNRPSGTSSLTLDCSHIHLISTVARLSFHRHKGEQCARTHARRPPENPPATATNRKSGSLPVPIPCPTIWSAIYLAI